MTLPKMMFDHYKDAGCGGNKSAVARELDIPRPRVNAILDTLNAGGGLGSTMTELLCAYRRKGLDINNVVDLYLETAAEQKAEKCPGVQKMDAVRENWRKKEHRLLLFNADLYKTLNRISGQFTCFFCYGGRCRGIYGESCPCWWLAGLMHSVCMLLEKPGTFDE